VICFFKFYPVLPLCFPTISIIIYIKEMEILKKIMVGKTFHRWTVLRETTQKNNNGNYLCLAQCKCGTKRMVSCSSIRSGKSKSCGCIASEKTAKRNKTHQKSKHPLYPRWNAMHRRCYLPS